MKLDDKWEYVIGLEIHAQISSKSKLFSSGATIFAAKANSQVELFDAAMPGTLPVLNKYCVEQAIKTGLALNARINLISAFDRKNYFYPDLPSNYQISQFFHPIVQDGYIEINRSSITKKIRINRIHLEQDAGKSIHDKSDKYSFIDLNRAGIGLMEIVTEPDIFDIDDAVECIKKIRNIMRYIETCDGDMEKGSLRCDANVSVKKVGDKKLGTRCEIKNLNSTRNIEKAIQYEINRQIDVLENGGIVTQETLLFDVDSEKTRVMRSKENENDYRYFPDPDLLPVKVDESMVESIRLAMPELPDKKFKRYTEELNLSFYDADVIVSDKKVSEYFDSAVSCNDKNSDKTKAKMIANWILTELFGRLNKNSITISDCKISPKMLSEMIVFIIDGTISSKMAKDIFDIMFETGSCAAEIIKERGFAQINDEVLLNEIVEKILANNQDKVKSYLSGKTGLFGFFVGRVMEETKGKANPTIVHDIIKKKLA